MDTQGQEATAKFSVKSSIGMCFNRRTAISPASLSSWSTEKGKGHWMFYRLEEPSVGWVQEVQCEYVKKREGGNSRVK
jgi:hypothetical protein